MKKIRRVNTQKRKAERKLAKERMENQAASFAKHPKECCVCSTPFERNHTTVKTWHVVIRGEKTFLTCPVCWDRINENIGETND
tara:strand:- start:258 stop:509 length:252 start_codon:yes stop_codon:yes gene_type:complete